MEECPVTGQDKNCEECPLNIKNKPAPICDSCVYKEIALAGNDTE